MGRSVAERSSQAALSLIFLIYSIRAVAKFNNHYEAERKTILESPTPYNYDKYNLFCYDFKQNPAVREGKSGDEWVLMSVAATINMIFIPNVSMILFSVCILLVSIAGKVVKSIAKVKINELFHVSEVNEETEV